MERQEFQHEALSPLVFCVIVPISLLSPTWCCCCSDFGAIRECYYCSNAATVPRRRMCGGWPRNEGEEVAQRTCEHDPDNDVTTTRSEFYKCGHKQKHPSGWELLTWDIWKEFGTIFHRKPTIERAIINLTFYCWDLTLRTVGNCTQSILRLKWTVILFFAVSKMCDVIW